jgi:hypothetical protein
MCTYCAVKVDTMVVTSLLSTYRIVDILEIDWGSYLDRLSNRVHDL